MVVIVVQYCQHDPSMISIIFMAVVIHTHEIGTKSICTYVYTLTEIHVGLYISSRL